MKRDDQVERLVKILTDLMKKSSAIYLETIYRSYFRESGPFPWATFGEAIQRLVDNGTIKVEYRASSPPVGACRIDEYIVHSLVKLPKQKEDSRHDSGVKPDVVTQQKADT